MKDNKFLKVWHYVVVDIFENAFVKISLILSTFYFIVFLLLQTYSFVRVASVSYFVQFGPTYFIIVYLILCILSLYFSSPRILSSIKDMLSWTVSVNEKWEAQYNRNLLVATVYMSVALFLGLITVVFYVIPTKQDKQLFFENNVAEMYFPKWQGCAIWISKVGFVPLTYVSIVQPTLRIIYCWMHVNFHIYNCLFFMQKLNGNDENIGENLKFCLKYHVRITLILRKLLTDVQVYVLPFQIVGTALIANVAIYYFWYEDVIKDQYLRIFSLGISCFVILFGLAKSGQAIEDVTDDILGALINVDWCDWNDANKKMYLMFLINTQKQFRINYSEKISLNYEMAVEIVKTFFSIACVMSKLQK